MEHRSRLPVTQRLVGLTGIAYATWDRNRVLKT